MKLETVRERFLDYMREYGHKTLPSGPMVPQEDSTTLFTGSGMQPLIPFLLGKEHPQGARLANSQKCFRANDIDEIGDNRHTTFFEMLGNWSLGDYFKEEQIERCFTFLTDSKIGLGLNPSRLYVTVFAGAPDLNIQKDTLSADVWQRLFAAKGVQADIAYIGSQEDGDKRGMKPGERIFFYDSSKNWWSRSGEPNNMPIGEPGGPDTEVFYDFGEEHTDASYAHLQPHPNTDSGRFLEICNSVFMEYLRTEKDFVPLPKKNVDFGAGLERFVAATENTPDIFRCDIFSSVIDLLEKKTLQAYEEKIATKDNNKDRKTYDTHPEPFRIIADHLRSALFIMAEGITPSNTDRGYVLRRLIRRALYSLRYQLEISDITLKDIASHFVAVYEKQYPEVAEKSILQDIDEEEKKFISTLKKGMQRFKKFLDAGVIGGEDAFMLQSTYGFPFELTVELAQKQGLDVSKEDYMSVMNEHRDTSRKGSEKKFKGGLLDTSDMSVKYHTATHLLYRALKDVLGEEVEQRGSNITPERLRFDFSYSQKMTDEEKKQVEKLINEKIKEGLPVSYRDMPYEEAKSKGVIGLFDYDKVVRVYFIGEYSKELCGGPHVENTAVLGKFTITKEQASGSGVRRIRAVLT